MNTLHIDKITNGTSLTMMISGRLDTNTAPVLEASVKDSLTDITELIFDLSDLEYISSAGLRILLSAQKKMAKQGSLIVRNVNDTVSEIFEITGFSSILTIV